MAPIPKTFDEQTNNAIDNVNRRLKDLAEFQIPRLRKCAGPLALQQRLSAELRDDLDACVQLVEVWDYRRG
jgi:protein transport protein SEC20